MSDLSIKNGIRHADGLVYNGCGQVLTTVQQLDSGHPQQQPNATTTNCGNCGQVGHRTIDCSLLELPETFAVDNQDSLNGEFGFLDEEKRLDPILEESELHLTICANQHSANRHQNGSPNCIIDFMSDSCRSQAKDKLRQRKTPQMK